MEVLDKCTKSLLSDQMIIIGLIWGHIFRTGVNILRSFVAQWSWFAY